MAIQNTALTTTATAIYVSSGNSAVSTIHLCNYTSSPITANLYVAASSGNVANNTTIVYGGVTISAYNTLIIDREKLVLAGGDTIYANVSSASAATATVSYMGF
jgi:hypothetical protein